MKLPQLPQWLITLAIVVALPTIACFGYYSYDSIGNKNGLWTLFSAFAYPMILIGFIGLVITLNSTQKSTLKCWLWILYILVPTVFLISIRT